FGRLRGPYPAGPRSMRGSVLPEGVLDLLAGLLQVPLGPVGLSLGFEALVVCGLADLLLGFADGLVLGVLQLVFPAHGRAPSLVTRALRLVGVPNGATRPRALTQRALPRSAPGHT